MGARSRTGWMAPTLVVVLAAAWLAVVAPSVGAAPAGGSASLSDPTPEPGQTITVRVSGLTPGQVSYIDYLPDAVRLATVTVGDDGGYAQAVRIPPLTKDGPKQIVVTGVGDDGRYAYLPMDFTIRGEPATAQLSDNSLVPGQSLRVSGRRFLPGASIQISIFPERVVLGTATADGDGNFAIDLRLPDDLRNGKHGITVTGLTAGGGYAGIKLYPTVSGGTGDVGGFTRVDGDGDALLLGTTSSTSTTTTTLPTTTLERLRAAPLDSGDSDDLVLIALLGLVVVGGVGAAAWLRTPSGRRWLRHRRRRRGVRF